MGSGKADQEESRTGRTQQRRGGEERMGEGRALLDLLEMAMSKWINEKKRHHQTHTRGA